MQRQRDGPRPCEDLRGPAQEAGISEGTLKRARGSLGVHAEQQRIDGRSCWFWRLPNAVAADDALDWPERERRALAQAQKESDELLAGEKHWTSVALANDCFQISYPLFLGVFFLAVWTGARYLRVWPI